MSVYHSKRRQNDEAVIKTGVVKTGIVISFTDN